MSPPHHFRDEPSTCPESRLLIHGQIRKSPYWNLTNQAGCHTYTVLSNTYHPRAYVEHANGGLLREHEHACRAAALWDETPDRPIAIRGRDALEFTDHLVTRDLRRRLPVGRACYALVCDPFGGIMGDPVILRIGHDELWMSGNVELFHFAKGVRAHSNHEVSIEELDVAPIHLHGPHVPALIRRLVDRGYLGEQVLDLARFEFCKTHFNSAPTMVMRMQLVDSPTYEFYPLASSTEGPRVWEGLVDEGAPYGLRVTSPPNIRRIEAGIRFYRSELTPSTNPFEVGLGWQVQFGDRPFIGREALEHIRRIGISRRLVGIRYSGPPVTWYNSDAWPVFVRGGSESLGSVTSTFWSPACSANIGYALLPLEYTEAGTALTVFRPDAEPAPANVTSIPFVGSHE